MLCVAQLNSTPSVPPGSLQSWPLIGRQVQSGGNWTNERAGMVCVDIDGIEMTEGNYIESRWCNSEITKEHKYQEDTVQNIFATITKYYI